MIELRTVATRLCLLLMLLVTAVSCSEESAEEQAIREQEQAQQAVRQANDFIYSGQPAKAIELLEPLAQAQPENPAVQEALGFAYSEDDQPAQAAAAFQASAEQDLNRSQNYLYAGQAYKKAGDWSAAATAFGMYLLDNPNDALAWKEHARMLTRLNKTREALDAYLQGTKLTDAEPTPEEKTDIADLFLRLGNLARAESWYRDALDDPDAEPIRPKALVGLLEIAYAQKQWTQAEQLIQRIDGEDPDLLAMTDMAFARAELKKWRQAQEQLASVRLSDQTAETPPAPTEPDAAEPATAEPEPVAAAAPPDNEPRASASATATGTATSAAAEPTPPRGSKEDLSPDPVVEPTEEPIAAVQPVEATTAETPQPDAAEPAGTVAPTPLAGESPAVQDIPPLGEPVTRGNTAEMYEMMPAAGERATVAQGDAMMEAGRHARAIEIYQEVLVGNYQDATVWSKLAEAYASAGQYANAELASLQAMESAPTQVEYTLQYLKNVQRARAPQTLMVDLQRAAKRHPESPEIAYALASGYERIENNARNAIFYYRRFLALAPDTHPRREEALLAISRLSQ